MTKHYKCKYCGGSYYVQISILRDGKVVLTEGKMTEHPHTPPDCITESRSNKLFCRNCGKEIFIMEMK